MLPRVIKYSGVVSNIALAIICLIAAAHAFERNDGIQATLLCGISTALSSLARLETKLC